MSSDAASVEGQLDAGLTAIATATSSGDWGSPALKDAVTLVLGAVMDGGPGLQHLLAANEEERLRPIAAFLGVCPENSDSVLQAVSSLVAIVDKSSSDGSSPANIAESLVLSSGDGLIPALVFRIGNIGRNADGEEPAAASATVEGASHVLGLVVQAMPQLRLPALEAGTVAAFHTAVTSSLLSTTARRSIALALRRMLAIRSQIPLRNLRGIADVYRSILSHVLAAKRAEDRDAEDDASDETANVLWGIHHIAEDGNYDGIDAVALKLVKEIVEILEVVPAKDAPAYGDDAPVVPRLLPSEVMAFTMEFLPKHHLQRLCMLNADIWKCCVCSNRRLYNRVRSNLNFNASIREPALLVMGDILAGSDDQAERAINHGALKILEAVATGLHPDNMDQCRNSWQELTWILSNVAASNEKKIVLAFLRSNAFYSLLIEALRAPQHPEVTKNAAWAAANAMETCLLDVPFALIIGAFAAAVKYDEVSTEVFSAMWGSVDTHLGGRVVHQPTSTIDVSSSRADAAKHLFELSDSLWKHSDDGAQVSEKRRAASKRKSPDAVADRLVSLLQASVVPWLLATGLLVDEEGILVSTCPRRDPYRVDDDAESEMED